MQNMGGPIGHFLKICPGVEGIFPVTAKYPLCEYL